MHIPNGVCGVEEGWGSMKKVLQIPNYQYPHIGGIEQTGRDIANVLLNQENFEQKMICFNEDAQDGEYICHRKETVYDQVDGVEVIRCGCIAKVASQSISLTYPRELKKILKDFHPDIVILHYPNPFVSSFFLPMLKNKTKFVLYWHLDITKQKLLGKLFHRQTIKLLKRADRVVATSPNYITGSPYLRQFEDKCMVIPSCINLERLKVTEVIAKKAAALKEKHKGKIICFAVGRHVPYKGMEYLVEASKFLSDDFAILIGGKGELTDTLKKEAENDRKIEFLGRVNDEELIAHYNACDIFAFPSITKNEAFGLALAEGMYFGKPAVTFTIPGSGVNYVNLDGVTGIECPNRDSRTFARAIEKLAKDSELRKQYGDAARQRVFDNFTTEQFEKNVEKLLVNL
jgi:rhamnosyl/mannosyltransferase